MREKEKFLEETEISISWGRKGTRVSVVGSALALFLILVVFCPSRSVRSNLFVSRQVCHFCKFWPTEVNFAKLFANIGKCLGSCSPPPPWYVFNWSYHNSSLDNVWRFSSWSDLVDLGSLVVRGQFWSCLIIVISVFLFCLFLLLFFFDIFMALLRHKTLLFERYFFLKINFGCSQPFLISLVAIAFGQLWYTFCYIWSDFVILGSSCFFYTFECVRYR